MINLGLISPSKILINRFLPAVDHIKSVNIAAISVPTRNEWFGNLSSERKELQIEKAQRIADKYNCKLYYSHAKLIQDKKVDSVYISTPPIQHFNLIQLALDNNKNIIVEKPICLHIEELKKIVKKSTDNNLVFHENYMFMFHKRLNYIKYYFKENLKNIRSMNIKFTFPFRGGDDFRYNLKMSGGAIFDTAGYIVKLVQFLSDFNVELKYSNINKKTGGTLFFTDSNKINYNCQFGMDHDYRCELELHMHNQTVYIPRIFTVRSDEEAKFIIKSNNQILSEEIFIDDSFKNSVEYFLKLNSNKDSFKKSCKETMETLKVLTMLYEK